MQFDPIFRLSKLYQIQKDHVENGACKIADDVIKEKESKFAEMHNKEDDASKPQIFIDQLFKMRDVFDTDEIRDEINTLIATVRLSPNMML